MIRDDNYIQISGWMINEFDLKGNELLIYALIHGFCQDGKSFFQGSLSYIAEWTNSTKQGVIKNLKSLIEKGFVQKVIVKSDGGIQFCKYYTVKSRGSENSGKQSLPPDRSTKFTTIQDESGKQSLPPQSTKFTATGQHSLPNKNLEILDINSTSAEIQKKENQESAEAGALALQKIKELFGGHFAFDERFISEILSLAGQFALDSSQIQAFLQYAFETSVAKKPVSLTNMFYKLAKSPAIMQDFVLKATTTKSATESVQKTCVCPVCGSKAKFFDLCPECHFDMNYRSDEKKIALEKQLFLLPKERREQLEKEYEEEMKRQNSVSFIERIKNPALRSDFEKRIRELYLKYGITA